jgi:hypothetical protein
MATVICHDYFSIYCLGQPNIHPCSQLDEHLKIFMLMALAVAVNLTTKRKKMTKTGFDHDEKCTADFPESTAINSINFKKKNVYKLKSATTIQ